MPNCFRLLDKTTKVAQRFSDIDDAMRLAFGEPPDQFKYLYGWYDVVGLYLAYGWTFDRILEAVQSEEMKKVVIWLRERYDSDAWAEIGRR